MQDNIRLLEDRVAQAAERLTRLSDERAELRGEIETLRKRLDDSNQAGSPDQIGLAERSELAERLREAMDLLRDT